MQFIWLLLGLLNGWPSINACVCVQCTKWHYGRRHYSHVAPSFFFSFVRSFGDGDGGGDIEDEIGEKERKMLSVLMIRLSRVNCLSLHPIDADTIIV